MHFKQNYFAYAIKQRPVDSSTALLTSVVLSLALIIPTGQKFFIFIVEKKMFALKSVLEHAELKYRIKRSVCMYVSMYVCMCVDRFL